MPEALLLAFGTGFRMTSEGYKAHRTDTSWNAERLHTVHPGKIS
jgi:hypothetical protein